MVLPYVYEFALSTIPSMLDYVGIKLGALITYYNYTLTGPSSSIKLTLNGLIPIVDDSLNV